MGAFHVFYFLQMVPNDEKCHICVFLRFFKSSYASFFEVLLWGMITLRKVFIWLCNKWFVKLESMGNPQLLVQLTQ